MRVSQVRPHELFPRPPPPRPMHPDPLKVVDNQEPWRVVPGRWVRMDKTGSQETS